MKIIEFVENFKNAKVENTKMIPDAISKYIKRELEVKDYVSFIEKQAIAQIVLGSCGHMKGNVISIDSVQKYIVFTITVLTAYTNFEFNGDETDIEAYDALCSYSVEDGTLLDAIIKTFEKEYIRCNDILNMMTADLLAENNIERQVDRFFDNLSDKIENLGNDLIGNMSQAPRELNQLDIDKLTNIISKIK